MPVPVLTKDDGLAEVRTKVADGARSLIELRSLAADKRGDAFAEDLRQHVEFIQHGDLIEKALVLEARAAADKAASDAKGAKSARANLEPETRSMGAQVVESDGFEAWAKRTGGGGGKDPFIIEVRNPLGNEVRNLIGGFTVEPIASGADAWLPVVTPQMVAGSMQRRRAFVRDLMSVQPTGLKVVPYLREQNQLTNETGAQMVAEGSAKSEVTLEFERYNAIVEKVTAWLPVTDEIATDAPTLLGYINTRLEYMLMIREEDQVLNGNGASPQLQGLDTLAGTQQQPTVSGGGPAGTAGDFAMTIGAAFGKIENVDGEPDGVVSNPLDFWAAVAKRHGNQFDYGFSTGAPGQVGNITWGETCVRTRAVASTKAYAGSWKLGSTLFDRQETTIKVADQHSDYFIRNLQVVLAEKRIALAWHRANLFVECVVPAS